ncbi:uncharacterized protein LOC141667260 [Apium graveolens]|uniref:uncharacterized protein LOC141667260 n=1 Tax=Apium graveolens TaxID=4045 RepID=UPI003D793000
MTSKAIDPAHKYATRNPTCLYKFTCNFCGKETTGGVFRAKEHLIGGRRNAKSCPKVPSEVKKEIEEYMAGKKHAKEDEKITFENLGSDSEEDLGEIEILQKSLKKTSGTSTSNQKMKGPLDLLLRPHPEKMVKKRKGQTRLDENDAVKKELRARACTTFARWMYDAGIPFNAVNYNSFDTAIEAIGQYGSGMKPPTYHEVRVPLLKKEVDTARKIMAEHKNECEANGCSIMSDGWTNKNQRTLINILVNCPKGSFFIESIDASSYSKTGQKVYELVC